MTDESDVRKANELFDVSEEFAGKVSEYMAKILSGESAVETVGEMLAWCRQFTGAERDFAMYAAGKTGCVNEFRADPMKAISILIG